MPLDPSNWLRPDWPEVTAFMTTRGPNFGRKAGDLDQALANRAGLAELLGARPVFLDQVHGADVVRLRADWHDDNAPRADAAVSTDPGLAVAILVADCLPVLFTAPGGVAGAHAGWRGLAAGVLEHTVAELCEAAGCEPRDVKAWLGACIGPEAFEVGDEVRVTFEAAAPEAAQCFKPGTAPGKWLADLAGLARQRLQAEGVAQLYGNDGSAAWCTVNNPLRFFSHRRDRVSGRFAACIWRD